MGILFSAFFYGTPKGEGKTCPLSLGRNVCSTLFTICFILIVNTIFDEVKTNEWQMRPMMLIHQMPVPIFMPVAEFKLSQVYHHTKC